MRDVQKKQGEHIKYARPRFSFLVKDRENNAWDKGEKKDKVEEWMMDKM